LYILAVVVVVGDDDNDYWRGLVEKGLKLASTQLALINTI
jgi:hypothetical protein